MAQGQQMMGQAQQFMDGKMEDMTFMMRGGKELLLKDKLFMSQRIRAMELCGCEFVNY